MAGVTALGAATGPAAVLAVPEVAKFAGCLGGLAAGAVVYAVYNGTFASAGTLGSASLGCVTGAVAGALTAAVIRSWTSSAIATALDILAPAQGAAVTAAQAQEVEMAAMGSSGPAFMTPEEAEAMATELNNYVFGLGLNPARPPGGTR